MRPGTTRRVRHCVAWTSSLLIVAPLTFAALASAQVDQPYDPPQDDQPYEEPKDDPPYNPQVDFDWEADESVILPGVVEQRLVDALSAPDKRFCHDTDYVLFRAERSLCAFAQGAKARCPALEVACARPASLDRIGSSLGFGGSAGGRGAGHAAEDQPEPDLDWSFRLPAAVGELMQVLLWAFILLLVVLAGYFIAKNWTSGKDDSKSKLVSDEPEDDAIIPASEELSEVEKDVLRLLARAKRLESDNRLEEALTDLHAALLRFLEARALIRLHKSRTNGDHVRALREHPELQSLLGSVAGELESVQFGARHTRGEAFHGLLSRVQQLVTHAGVLLLLGLLGSQLLACDDWTEERGSDAAWGVTENDSASGFSVLAELLRAQGRPTKNHVGGFTNLPIEDTLLIYDSTSLSEHHWDQLEGWIERGGELVIAGERRGAEHFGAKLSGTVCTSPVTATAEYEGPVRKTPSYYTAPFELDVLAPLRSVEITEGLHPVLTCANGQILVARRDVGDGSVLLMADADLLANGSLASADNAIVVLGLLSGTGPIRFSGEMAGAGSDSPYQALQESRLGPLFWQGLLLLLVFYLGRGIAFRPLRDPPREGRQAFIRHILALGRAYTRRKASSHALQSYSAWALDRLRERVRPGSQPKLHELAEAVSKRTGRDQKRVLQILVEAATSSKEKSQTMPNEHDMKTLQELEQLVMETGGAR